MSLRLDPITLPSGSAPSKGSFWDKLMAPFLPILDGLMWALTTFVLPAVLIAAAVMMGVAYFRGDKTMSQRARSAFVGVPAIIVYIAGALLFANMLKDAYVV